MGDSSAIGKKEYFKELKRLTVELVKLQEWVKAKGLKVVLLFEGRDAAGKGGVIKAITGGLNARYARIAALGVPTEKEKTQWYFQRYVAHLPAGGEMVFFDRSWYNRAGVEQVMGFCTEEEYREFARTVPEFERMLIRSGITLIKYWFSVSDEVQESRFEDRLKDPAKRWKLSPMDMSARSKWVDYSRAKDAMFEFSDTPDSPWHVVDADDKFSARLNTIRHFLGSLPYEDLTPDPIEMPARQKAGKYARPPIDSQRWVPRVYPGALVSKREVPSPDGSTPTDAADAIAASGDEPSGALLPEKGARVRGKKSKGKRKKKGKSRKE